MSELTIIEKTDSQTVIYSERARQYAKEGKAENTKRAYQSAWRDFENWCMAQGHRAMPASVETIIEYLTSLADRGQKISTINVKRAAISSAHVMGSKNDPTKHGDVTILMKGITRTLARRGKTIPTKKEPLTLDALQAMLSTINLGTISGKRDKALLLLGYAGAFRRSELINANVEDVRTKKRDLIITLPTSKTDQEGEGLKKHIEMLDDKTLCPVRAYRDYLNSGGINSGPIFRRLDRNGCITGDRLTAQSVALIIKRMAKDAGLDWRSFSGHSMRAGFVTSAHLANATDSDIMAQTGHKSGDTLRMYIRDAGKGAKSAMKAAFGEGGE